MGEGRGHVTFYVAVADVTAALELIESKGGKKAFGPHPIPDGGIIAGFLDPEEHLIGLAQGPAKTLLRRGYAIDLRGDPVRPAYRTIAPSAPPARNYLREQH